MAMPAMVMPGMTMPAGGMPGGTECPALFWASVVTGALYLVALVAMVWLRPSPAELAVSSARLVVGLRFAPLSALVAVVSGVPLAAIVAMEGPPGPLVIALAAGFLAVAAALGAVALLGLGHLILAFARRLVGAIIAAFRLLAPGGERTWHALPVPPLAAAGLLLARRRPSRAPPVCVQPLFTR